MSLRSFPVSLDESNSSLGTPGGKRINLGETTRASHLPGPLRIDKPRMWRVQV